MSQETPTTTTATPAEPCAAEPQKEHHWLHQLVGEWAYEGPAGPPEGPSETMSGTETVHSIGGLWIQAEARGQMPDGKPATMVTTLGYDPAKQRFVGTFIGSMMTNLWVYDGELDAAQRVLTLNSEGPSMTGDGTTANYQDIIELKDDNHRVLTARVQDTNGTWQHLMRMEYRRVK